METPSWWIRLLITGRPVGGWFHITGFGVPFNGEPLPGFPSVTPPHRVTAGSLWYKRPIDLFILLLQPWTFCAFFKQVFSFHCLWKKLIKNQLQEIRTHRNWYLSKQDICWKITKTIKPQVHTMKPVYLRSPTTDVTASCLSKERIVPSQQKEKEWRVRPWVGSCHPLAPRALGPTP